jgi:hypothetical protein
MRPASTPTFSHHEPGIRTSKYGATSVRSLANVPVRCPTRRGRLPEIADGSDGAVQHSWRPAQRRGDAPIPARGLSSGRGAARQVNEGNDASKLDFGPMCRRSRLR